MKYKDFIGCKGKTSLVYSKVRHKIERRYQFRFKQKIQPWIFWNCGSNVLVEYYDGTTYNLGKSNLEFSGTIVDVFWGSLIQKYIEDDIQELVSYSCEQCEARQISPTLPLEEARLMLKQMAFNLFYNMAVIDRSLRSDRMPKKTTARSIEAYVNWANAIVDQRINAELEAETIAVKINRFSSKYKAYYGLVMLILGAVISLSIKGLFEQLMR